MRSLLPAGLAAALVALVACGGSSTTGDNNDNNNNNNTGGPGGQTYSGVLSDGAVVELQFGSATAATPRSLAVRPAPLATLTITGTITMPGASPIAVTGTYDTDAQTFTVSGAGYTLSGSFAGGQLSGDCTTPSGNGIFVALQSSGGASVTTYCGAYSVTHGDQSTDEGTFSLVIGGSAVYGLADDGTQLSGTISGATLTLSIPGHDGSATGTLNGHLITGSISAPDGTTGTFTASSDACTAPATGTCPAASFDAGVPSVTATYNVSALPPATGGVIADGTYFRTAITYYGFASGDDTTARKMQLTVNGTEVKLVQQSDSDPIETQASTASLSGTDLTLTLTCIGDNSVPIGLQQTRPYSASGSTLKVYDLQRLREDTFTRQ